MLAVGYRHKLVLAALAHGAQEARLDIAGEIVALQRTHPESEMKIDAESGHDERNEDGSEAVDGIVRGTNDGLFPSPLYVGHGCSEAPSA